MNGNEMTEEEFAEVLSEMEMTEEYFLDYCMEIGSKMLSYKDIAKLEELGLKVITVETPYGTKRYTTNLGGTVECGFCKNGTYEFKITVGGKTITQEVEIGNIRTYDNTQPHTVKIEGEYGSESNHDNIVYATDSLEEWTTLVDSMEIDNINEKLRIKMMEARDMYNSLNYVIKDEEFYKYFSNVDEWVGYNINIELYYYLVIEMETLSNATSRQAILYTCLKDPSRIDLIYALHWLGMPEELYDFYDNFVGLRVEEENMVLPFCMELALENYYKYR